jgi:hypothetical protein
MERCWETDAHLMKGFDIDMEFIRRMQNERVTFGAFVAKNLDPESECSVHGQFQ